MHPSDKRKHVWYRARLVDLSDGSVIAAWYLRSNNRTAIRNGVKRFIPGAWLPIGQALWTRVDNHMWVYYRRGCDSALHNGQPLFRVDIDPEPLADEIKLSR